MSALGLLAYLAASVGASVTVGSVCGEAGWSWSRTSAVVAMTWGVLTLLYLGARQ